MGKIKIKSIGSCATREVQPKLKDTTLSGNVGFCSLFTITGNSIPLHVTKDLLLDPSSSPSDWEIKMMNIDLSKNHFNYIRENPCNYAIIDLIDERYNLLEYNGSYTLLTNPFKLIDRSSVDFREVTHSQLDASFVDEKIREFCNTLLQIYEPDKIIINKALMVYNYMDNDGNIRKFANVKLINEFNEYCGRYYDRLAELIPQCKIIEMPEDTLADPNHRWGLTAYHYREEFYDNLAKEIDNYVLQKEVNNSALGRLILPLCGGDYRKIYYLSETKYRCINKIRSFVRRGKGILSTRNKG